MFASWPDRLPWYVSLIEDPCRRMVSTLFAVTTVDEPVTLIYAHRPPTVMRFKEPVITTRFAAPRQSTVLCTRVPVTRIDDDAAFAAVADAAAATASATQAAPAGRVKTRGNDIKRGPFSARAPQHYPLALQWITPLWQLPYRALCRLICIVPLAVPVMLKRPTSL
jgi:hypothetical protein